MPDLSSESRMECIRRIVAVFAMSLALLPGCGGGGGGGGDNSGGVIYGNPADIVDADAALDQVLESAVPGTPVGLTLALPTAGSGSITFSLLDSAGGTFTIDPVTGVVRLAAAVDFESSPLRTIIAQLDVGLAPDRRLYQRQFQISILDSPAPALELTFPYPHARFADAAISVSGRVSHPQPTSVRVSASAGGAVVQGEIVDGKFAVRDIPIVGDGNFTLTVVATHPGGDTTTRSMTLSREPELSDVPRMVLDEPRGRLVLVDRYTATVVASPLNGGPRTMVSGRQVGSGPAFVEPIALCLDPDGQNLYVVDGALKAIYRVDLVSGNRTRLAGSGPPIYSPVELDFDPIRHALVLSDESVGILTIDPATGERRLLSSFQSAGPYIYAYRGLAFDPRSDQILVSDGSSIFAVSPGSGNRRMISDANSDPISRFLYGMTVMPHSNFAYAADEFVNGVVRVDLATGARETVTSSGLELFNYLPVGSGPDLQYPEDVVVSSDDRLFLIEGEYADPLIEVKPNGDRVLVRNAALGTGVNFRGPQGIKYDAARNLLLVADNVADFLAAIDPATGNRTVITGRSDGKGSIDFDLMDGAFDAAGQYYYVDFTTKTLYAVRAGETPRVVSDMATGSGPALNHPTGIEIDALGHTAYVIDGEAVVAIDLVTGARRVIAAEFTSLTGLSADLANQRLFVSEGSGRVFTIDLASNTRHPFSLPAADATWSGDIAHDSATHSLLIVRENPARLDRIDTMSATISPVDSQAPNCGPAFKLPIAVAVDSARQVAYVTDDFYDAVIAVDLRTGCRQLIAK
jgi:DNA-binding beta-propeller fold protein YncE